MPVALKSPASSADSFSLAIPEIEELHAGRAVLARGQEDVLGLEIAVNDPERVGLVERARDLPQVEHHVGGGERGVIAAELLQVPPAQPLHHQEGHAAEPGRDVGVRHLHHVIAVDAGRRAGFAAEARQGELVVHHRGVEDLERELLIGVEVLHEVHRAHAALCRADARRDSAPRGQSPLRQLPGVTWTRGPLR